MLDQADALRSRMCERAVQRLTQRHAEAVAAGLALFPEGLRHRVEFADVFVGDPNFADLHRYKDPDYQRVPHCTYLQHQKHLTAQHRKTTVCFPERLVPTLHNVVHEFGHVLHEQIGLAKGYPYGIVPVTSYAQKSYYEAFAESVMVEYAPEFSKWPVRPGERFLQFLSDLSL